MSLNNGECYDFWCPHCNKKNILMLWKREGEIFTDDDITWGIGKNLDELIEIIILESTGPPLPIEEGDVGTVLSELPYSVRNKAQELMYKKKWIKEEDI